MASVLIVEDEKEIAELLRSYLERDGFQVAVAANGFEAIDRFEA
ncbi:MAG TPA: response regulator, partial [bacterium]|nr:response regulator [bacterium]